MDLKLDHHSKDGIEIVDVEGEIDVYTAPRLRELLIELVNTGFYQLVVNMEKVEFLDSTGLGVLVGGDRLVLPGGRHADGLECLRDLRPDPARPLDTPASCRGNVLQMGKLP